MRFRSIETICPLDPNDGAEPPEGSMRRPNRVMRHQVGQHGVESIRAVEYGVLINRRFVPWHLVGPGDPLLEAEVVKPLVADPQITAIMGIDRGVDTVKLADAVPAPLKREDLQGVKPSKGKRR